MRIGIDARFVGPEGTGLGKYTEKLIINLAKIDHSTSFAIFLNKSNWDYLKLPQNFTKVQANIPWYSVAEQIKLPQIFANQKLDLMHVPHFNVPIRYKGKFVVTIHDLIHHQFSQHATTKNPIIFQLKRFAYKKVIAHAVTKAAKILTPSNYVKDEIVKIFKINPDKIIVTYEAAEEEYFRTTNYQLPTTNYQLIYVGNAYPHKNLNRLLDAMKMINKNSYSSSDLERSERESRSSRQARTIIKLVLVCPRDVFWQRLQREIKLRQLEDNVELKGYMEPQELTKLFQKATAYVFPSLSEGFGIPGLNAMASNLPVICSNIPTLKEVYGDAALYFNPKDSEDIAAKIHQVLTEEKTKSDLVEKGREQVKKYSWLKMARQTLEVYKEASRDVV